MKLAATFIRTVAIGFLIVAGPAHAQQVADFTISESYLRKLADGNSILVNLPVQLTHRTNKVHPLASDCEMHLAGKPTDIDLGTPEYVVVEPPNLCKNKPSEGDSWPSVFDDKVLGKKCVATGFPRIFTEHAQGGDDGGANPNHVFELHPAMKIVCGSDTLSFESFLTYYPGMRAIKPSSADNCVRTRTVSIRFADDRYEITEDGGGNCGNFAIVEVGYVEPKWVRTIGGGHSAIARVSLNGESRTTLKIYTLHGSDADKWLAKVQSTGQGGDRVYLHGMLTYDYFAFVKTVRSEDKQWRYPTKWTNVQYPFAFVVFGMPESAPWEEND
jgi:hypothetical protein